MGSVVIENPILNSPFAEPRRHWKFGEDGITDEIVEQHRRTPPRKSGKGCNGARPLGSSVNNLREFGRWAFVEITDPSETKQLLRNVLKDDVLTPVAQQATLPTFTAATTRPKRDAAAEPSDLRIPVGNRFEKLSGDRKGQWSLRINDQYRIRFSWENAETIDVEIVDYH